MNQERINLLLEALRREVGPSTEQDGEFAEVDQSVVLRAETIALAHQWKQAKESYPVPAELQPYVGVWRADLTEERVGAYCDAAASLMRGAILDASNQETEAIGRIESLAEAPYFEIFALVDSRLAKERGEGRIAMGVSEFAHQIALRCEVPLPWGDLAWRWLAAVLHDGEADVFPRLQVHRTRDGAIEVRLDTTEGG